jgi:hypothetical protein
MAVNTRNNIVTNGLVLYLDAANRISYVSGSTTWNDLSGFNNSGSLVGGPAFSSAGGGSIVFDGVDDTGLISNNSTLNFDTGSFSVCLVASRSTGSSSVLRALAKGAGNDTAGQAGYFIGASNTLWVFSVNPSGTRRTLSSPMIYNQLTYICGVWGDEGLQKLYINGELKSSAVQTSGSTTGTSNLSLGSRESNSDLYWQGSITQTSIYNRALSQQEITQNYNATKARFGLT